MSKSFKFLRLVCVIVLLLLMLSSSRIDTSPLLIGSAISSPSSVNYNAYPDYALSSLNAHTIITLGLLNTLTGGNTSVGAYESVIEHSFLSMNIREVLLDISWQNYSIGSIPYEDWINNWLTACDILGVYNVFYTSQFTESGVASPWIMSLISSDPSTQTYNAEGQPVNFVSFENPDVAKAMERDLSILDPYYGYHQSWVGIGTGYTESDPYYSSNSTIPTLGYSNFTLQTFSNSIYYERDVNASGYLPNGEQDILWTEFRSVPDSTVLSSGNWMTSTSYEVYGTGSNQRSMSIRFFVPTNESNLLLQWYGDKVGNPGDIVLTIVNDSNGAPIPSQVVANTTQTQDAVSTAAAWQSPASVGGEFRAGYYWLEMSSPTSDSNNYYNVFMRDYAIQNAQAVYVLPVGSGQIQGSSILWLKNFSGSSIDIYPYEGEYIPSTQQQFVAKSSFSFNTVYLFLSDRIYNPTNATLEILDSTTGNVVATGTMSQQLTRGLQNWIPIKLNNVVTTISGDTYSMSISEPNGGYSWQTVLRGITFDPPSAGFQNQSQSWLFRLGMVNFTQGFSDFTAMTTTGVDSVHAGHPDAISFTVPSSTSATQVLTNVSVLLKGGSGFYPSNSSLTVSIYSNDPKNVQPTGSPLATVNVAGGIIPRSGWLNVPGFNISLATGTKYWAVFSTGSSSLAFIFARLVSTYNLDFLVSTDGGVSWNPPAEGPTELSFYANFTSGASIGNHIDNIPTIVMSQSQMFAEPFVVKNNTNMIGVFIGPLGGSSSPANSEIFSVNPDNGKGQPSSAQLASGVLYSENITLNYGLQFVQFSSAAHLKAGETYWIVVHPSTGSFTFSPVEYSETPSTIQANYTGLFSQDLGFSWYKLSNDTTVLPYMIASSPIPVPTYSTSNLSNDLENYHNFAINVGQLRGWNAYIKTSELNTFSDIASWFQSTTGKNFSFYTTSIPNVINQVQFSNLNTLPPTSSPQSCSALSEELLANMNLLVSQFNEIGNLGILNQCPNLVSLAQSMNYMKNLGSGFVANASSKVLIVGDESSTNLTKFLSNAYDVSYISIQGGSNISSFGDLSQYTAIVWLSNNASVSYETVIASYLRNGGTLIVADQPPSWMSGFLGVNWNGLSSLTSGTTASVPSAKLSSLVTNTQYSGILNEFRISNKTILGQAGGLTVGVTQQGSGIVEFIQINNQEGYSQSSDALVVLSNMIANSMSKNETSPFWYQYPTGSEGSNIYYSIIGKPQGPLLVWMFNPATNPLDLTLHLNASYYGIASDWVQINPQDFNASQGNGPDVAISSRIAPEGWSAIYVVSRPLNLNIAYSSFVMTRQLAYNGQALYSLSGPVNQSVITIIPSNESANIVLLDDRENLTLASSPASFLNLTQGFAYDSLNHLLLIKYISNGNDTIRVVLPSTNSSANSLSFYILPTEIALALLVSVELTLFSFLWFKRRKQSRG